VGDTVNLEVDVVAKYVERLTVGYVGAGAPDQGTGHREAVPVSSGDDAAEQQVVGS
jgi:hypothetical protein